MRILCWNVNGIRAAEKKGFLDWLVRERADIVCLQETKADPEQLSEALRHPDGYESFWAHSTARKGYSGVGIYVRPPYLNCVTGIDEPRFDVEGRSLVLETKDFFLFNGYFPNGGEDLSRVPYKLAYSDTALATCKSLERKGKPVIICGDLNTAHTEIDIARPRENEGTTGFLPIERAWLDKLVASGYIDIFRHLHPNERHHYTWWSFRTNARERNVGWRIDYFFVTPNLVSKVQTATIESKVMGSDHCPIGLELKI